MFLYASINQTNLWTFYFNELERAGKLENEPFSEFGWKSWKIIGFSPDLAGKAGILFWAYNNQQHYQMKVILSRNSSKEEKIV